MSKNWIIYSERAKICVEEKYIAEIRTAAAERECYTEYNYIFQLVVIDAEIAMIH